MPMDKRFVYILFLNVSSLLLSLISVFYLSRLISIEDFGLFNFYTYLGSFFILFNSLSCELYIVMAVGRDKDLTGVIYNTFINLRTILSFILFFGFYSYSLLFGIELYAVILVLSILINSYLSGHFIPFLRLIDKLNIGLFAQNIQIIFFTGLVAFFDKTLLFISISYLLSIIFTVFPVFLYVNSQIPFKYSFTVELSHVKKSLKYFFNQLVDLIYIRLDVIFVQMFFGLQLLGIYTAGTKLTNAFMMIPQALMFVLVPDLHKSKDQDKLIVEYKKFTNYVVEIGSIFCILIFYLREQVIQLIYGTKYFELAGIMPLFLINFFCIILNFPNLLMFEIKLFLRKRFFIKIYSIIILAILLSFSMLRHTSQSVLIAIILSNICTYFLSVYFLKIYITGTIFNIFKVTTLIFSSFLLIEIFDNFVDISLYKPLIFIVMSAISFFVRHKLYFRIKLWF
jgi:O-antigen/teichoic acid export membrane protein